MNNRPAIISVHRIHQISQRREETRLARYNVLVGSVSRIINRAVAVDARRTSVFIPLMTLMGREMTAPGIDVSTAIEYVCTVLTRNGFTCTHIGEGVLLIRWPPAPLHEDLMQLPEQVRAQPTSPNVPAGPPAGPPASLHPKQEDVDRAKQTFEDIRKVVARYKPPA